MMVGKAGTEDFDRVARLGAQIVAVKHRSRGEHVLVVVLGELRQQIDAKDVLRARKVGVRLILGAEREETREPLRRAPPRDFAEIGRDALLHLLGRVRRGRPFEIGARDFKRTHAEIQRGEFELNARQVRVEQQHALERRDRRLIVAELGRDIGIGERGVEIARLRATFFGTAFPFAPAAGCARCRRVPEPTASRPRGRPRRAPAGAGYAAGASWTAQIVITVWKSPTPVPQRGRFARSPAG